MILPINFSALFSRLRLYWEMLTTNPLNFIFYLMIFIISILGALILHEVAHGYVAYRCGDPTAKYYGRLSLNPLKHLDPIGTASMVLLGIGWAKPVPVNPRNFRNARWDDLKVSLAGIVTNFCLFVLSEAICVALVRAVWSPQAIEANTAQFLLSPNGYGSYMIYYGIDAQYAHLLRNPFLSCIMRFFMLFAQLNLSLAVFNFIPLPPLDGFHVLNDTILRGKLTLNSRLFQICQVALLILCVLGILSRVIGWATNGIGNGVLTLMLKIAGLA